MTGGRGPDTPITSDDLRVVYQRGAQPAVDGLSLRLGPGDGLLVTGERGSGKSSVLKAVLGLVRFEGDCAVYGAYPGTPAVTRRVGYGPQGKGFAGGLGARGATRLVARLRGLDDVAGAAEAALDAAGVPAGARDRPESDVELIRRLSLACALVGSPPLLVLDDPWEFPETEAAIARTREEGGAVLAATHDPGNLPELLGRSVRLVDGVPQ